MKFGERNVGMTDRLVRVVLGIILLGLFVLNYIPSPWSYLTAFIGLVLLITGAVGTCGLYSILGISTIEKKT